MSKESIAYNELKKLVEEGERIQIEELHQEQYLCTEHVSGSKTDEWMEKVNIFNERYLNNKHPSYQSIFRIYFHRNSHFNSERKMLSALKAVLADKSFFASSIEQNYVNATEESDYTDNTISIDNDMQEKNKMSNDVFIVHGHDDVTITEVENFLRKLKLNPIVLRDQPDRGLTIIEKIEKYTDVAYAVVLYTPCDLGRAAEDTELRCRARQNVVFEHGFLNAKLTRERVAALVKDDSIEIPGDCSGILYISMNTDWKLKLARNMKAAGLDVDLNDMA